jgi:hypothetical protein
MIHHVDVAGFTGNALFQDMSSFVDQRVTPSAERSLRQLILRARDAFSAARCCSIMSSTYCAGDGVAFARLVVVPALALVFWP